LSKATESAELVATRRLAASAELSSLADLVKAKANRSMLLVDISDSMDSHLATGERAIDALRKVVDMLRDTHPVPVAAFGFDQFGEGDGEVVKFIDNVPEPQGSTPLHTGIDFAKEKGATHLVVVTDGSPDSTSEALRSAKRFGGPIDVFYVGDGNDDGAKFCARLAAATGGTANVTDLNTKLLTSKIRALIGPGLPEGL
jgi:hypothetical protein